jgi:hypothetical protein
LKDLKVKISNRQNSHTVFWLHIVLLVAGCRALDAAPQLEVGTARPLHAAALPGSFAELLDFRSIPHLKSWRTFQASGYDRGGGFYDSGNFLRIEDNRHYVLMEAKGPGCIDRMWFTYKSPVGKEPYDLLIFIDSTDEPLIRVDLDTLFSGKRRPFVSPLAGLCGNKTFPARYSYVPIGFQKSCKVVLVPRAPQERYNYRTNSAGEKIPHIYYQITYRKFEADTRVRRFRWNPEREESEALVKIQSVWSNAGLSPWGALAELKEEEVKVDVEPKGWTSLFDIAGPGVIYGLEFFTGDPEGLWLQIYWDGSASPDVNVPVGPFFACSGSVKPRQDVRGLWMGFAGGRYYCYLPMPFRKTAGIRIRSQAKKKVSIAARLQYRKEDLSDTDGVFCAHRYDHLSPPVGKNYTVLDVFGVGHFAGLVMDRPGHMEGDDFFFVDGEKQPSIHGTGTEDFFSFAWGLGHTASLASHGITIQSNTPICYRMHLPAAVPFSDSLLVTWEHGHDTKKGPNLHKGRYSGVVFYYKKHP